MSNFEKVTFAGTGGEDLAGRLDLPAGPPRAVALFAHCFTCGKDIVAASRISRALTGRGIAVLRFDFTGLGESDGEFANSTFSSNVDDLVRAAEHLRATVGAPTLLIGHSLGGAAVLAAAHRIAEAGAVVTIGAPADPAHVSGLLDQQRTDIEIDGVATVSLAGRPLRVRREFLADIAGQPQQTRIANLGRALLVLHAPGDEIVGIDHARRIYQAARHPKSFVSLDDADHLLSSRGDAEYAAAVIAAWSERYLPERVHGTAREAAPERNGSPSVVVTGAGDAFTQQVKVRGHRLVADEPSSAGGDDLGPTPYDLLLAALGTCTSMTVGMYARRKNWPLRSTTVTLTHSRVHAADCETCETPSGQLDHIRRDVRFDGDLDNAQRARLLEIADRCPVHRTLQSEVVVETVTAEPDLAAA